MHPVHLTHVPMPYELTTIAKSWPAFLILTLVWHPLWSVNSFWDSLSGRMIFNVITTNHAGSPRITTSGSLPHHINLELFMLAISSNYKYRYRYYYKIVECRIITTLFIILILSMLENRNMGGYASKELFYTVSHLKASLHTAI